MASNVFGAKQFKPTPPDKGSFPLDHDGECKKFYLQFMICLGENEQRNSACRAESQAYLACRFICVSVLVSLPQLSSAEWTAG